MLKETKIFIFCSIVTLFIFNFFQNQLSGNYYNQALIFCLPMLWPGIAHGSLDILIAKNLGIIRNKQHLAGFISLYILLACCMIFLWYQFPFFSLIFFLIISVMHFGISDNLKSEEQNYFLKMLIRGFTPICMPFFFHQKEVENIFLILTKNSVLIERFHFINIWITFFIFIIFLILIIKMLFNKENNFVKDKFFHEYICIFFCFYYFEPLLAFFLYFCFFHSLRHLFFEKKSLNLSFKSLILKTIPMTFLSLIFIISLYYYNNVFGFSEEQIFVLFLALAGLTLPHMILINFSRFLIKST